MSPPPPSTSISLDQTFTHNSPTHSYTIHWASLGSPASSPLIFIHGTPWSSLVWTPFALSLSRQFHVYLFDNPGFGASPLEVPLTDTHFSSSNKVEELDSDLARQSEAFAALFKFWKENEGWEGRKSHVVAHDHGGLMSLRANLLHDWILESYIRQAAFTELSKHAMEMLKEPWLREGGKKGFVRQLCQANWRSTEEVEGRYAEVGRNMPVKIVWGAQDDWILAETAERLGKALDAKEVVVIEDAGHLIMYDQPAQLGVELGRWLSTVSPN